jgi:prepilin-type N-terminal cleavage/methylation domain-containing protein
MPSFRSRAAFTLLEMLVVVAVIALLMGLLLPAIARARDQAKLSQSRSNLHNLAIALGSYGAEWNDRQPTFIDDDMSRYGHSRDEAFPAWHDAHGGGDDNWDYPPPVILGWGDTRETSISSGQNLWAFWMSWSGNWPLAQPIVFEGLPNQIRSGSFRIPNARQLSMYLSGRFYDRVYYAPKDDMVLAALGGILFDQDEFDIGSGVEPTWWSSYCLSPASMFSPDVMRPASKGGWQSPWDLAAGFRCPSFSQIRYASLKTAILEHHWLQNRRVACNPAFGDHGRYNGCEPYYFNHGWESVPQTLFHDGHIDGLGTRQAMAADQRVRSQTGGTGDGLWSRDTPFGAEEGYFMDVGYDFTETSFHVLTTGGCFGRDIVSR